MSNTKFLEFVENYAIEIDANKFSYEDRKNWCLLVLKQLLIENATETIKENKPIIVSTIFEFCRRNSMFMNENTNFCKVFYNKILEILKEEVYKPYYEDHAFSCLVTSVRNYNGILSGLSDEAIDSEVLLHSQTKLDNCLRFERIALGDRYEDATKKYSMYYPIIPKPPPQPSTYQLIDAFIYQEIKKDFSLKFLCGRENVALCTDKSNGEKYVIKWEQSSEEDCAKGYFEFEKNFHSNIGELGVKTYFYDSVDISEYMGFLVKGIVTIHVMEYFDGVSIDRAKLSYTDIQDLFQSLYKLHEKGLYHGDFHYSNILVKKDNGKNIYKFIDPDYKPFVSLKRAQLDDMQLFCNAIAESVF